MDTILASPALVEELFACCADEVVRLRMSNAMKRVEPARHDLLVPYIDRFLTEIGALDQASAQWTLADQFGGACAGYDGRPDGTGRGDSETQSGR